MAEKLKPCPFCGGNNIKEEGDGQDCWIQCMGCGARAGIGGDDEGPDAVAWNTRVKQPRKKRRAVMSPRQKSLFDTARKEYPGTKRGFDVEWGYLQIVCLQHKLDLEQTVLDISAGVRRQIEWRYRAEIAKAVGANILVPFPKNFKTWLYNRCWTEEFPEIPQRKKTRIQRLNEQREARKKNE